MSGQQLKSPENVAEMLSVCREESYSVEMGAKRVEIEYLDGGCTGRGTSRVHKH